MLLGEPLPEICDYTKWSIREVCNLIQEALGEPPLAPNLQISLVKSLASKLGVSVVRIPTSGEIVHVPVHISIRKLLASEYFS